MGADVSSPSDVSKQQAEALDDVVKQTSHCCDQTQSGRNCFMPYRASAGEDATLIAAEANNALRELQDPAVFYSSAESPPLLPLASATAEPTTSCEHFCNANLRETLRRLFVGYNLEDIRDWNVSLFGQPMPLMSPRVTDAALDRSQPQLLSTWSSRQPFGSMYFYVSMHDVLRVTLFLESVQPESEEEDAYVSGFASRTAAAAAVAAATTEGKTTTTAAIREIEWQTFLNRVVLLRFRHPIITPQLARDVYRLCSFCVALNALSPDALTIRVDKWTHLTHQGEPSRELAPTLAASLFAPILTTATSRQQWPSSSLLSAASISSGQRRYDISWSASFVGGGDGGSPAAWNMLVRMFKWLPSTYLGGYVVNQIRTRICARKPTIAYSDDSAVARDVILRSSDAGIGPNVSIAAREDGNGRDSSARQWRNANTLVIVKNTTDAVTTIATDSSASGGLLSRGRQATLLQPTYAVLQLLPASIVSSCGTWTPCTNAEYQTARQLVEYFGPKDQLYVPLVRNAADSIGAILTEDVLVMQIGSQNPAEGSSPLKILFRWSWPEASSILSQQQQQQKTAANNEFDAEQERRRLEKNQADEKSRRGPNSVFEPIRPLSERPNPYLQDWVSRLNLVLQPLHDGSRSKDRQRVRQAIRDYRLRATGLDTKTQQEQEEEEEETAEEDIERPIDFPQLDADIQKQDEAEQGNLDAGVLVLRENADAAVIELSRGTAGTAFAAARAWAYILVRIMSSFPLASLFIHDKLEQFARERRSRVALGQGFYSARTLKRG